MPDRYACIVVDPPWPMSKTGKRKSRPNQTTSIGYKTMTVEQIAALPVKQLAQDDAAIFLWTTHKFLAAGIFILDKWGFRYQRCLTWDKGNGMTLFGFHHRTEFCLFGYCGHLEPFQRKRAFPTVFGGKSMRHSAKPEEFFALVEAYTSGPFLELFARNVRGGWHAWGNEVECTLDEKAKKILEATDD